MKSPDEAKSTGRLDPLDGHVVHLHMYYAFPFGPSVYLSHFPTGNNPCTPLSFPLRTARITPPPLGLQLPAIQHNPCFCSRFLPPPSRYCRWPAPCFSRHPSSIIHYPSSITVLASSLATTHVHTPPSPATPYPSF